MFKVFLATMIAYGGANGIEHREIEATAKAIWQERDRRVDPYLLAALSYQESRWKPVVSRTGDCGIMQVNPRWSRWNCKQLMRRRTAVKAAISALVYWRDKRKFGRREPAGRWLCHYNGGNRCERSSRGYARRVWAIYRGLRSRAGATAR